MAGGSSRDRARARRGREAEVDVAAVALTVQIILCVLLLLAIWITKKVDEESYSNIKREYTGLVGEENSDLSAYFAQVAGLGEGFFDKAEALLRHLFGQEAPAQEGSGGEASSQDSVSLPVYDYLGGAEGRMSVQLAGNTGTPTNCTLLPVAVSGRLRPPVPGMITSCFAWREHPISGMSDFHTGIDIAAAEGTRILAALPGEVVQVGEDEIYGKYIILRHATNLETMYAHCGEIIAQEGMAVSQGERIAKVGMTGTATGYHLHFSVIADGLFVDPLWVLYDNISIVEE